MGVDLAFPSLQHRAIVSAAYYIDNGIDNGASVATFAVALLAGAAVTLLTRMRNGTDSEVAELAATVGIAFLLGGVRLLHSILDSLLAFAALETGRATFGHASWLGRPG